MNKLTGFNVFVLDNNLSHWTFELLKGKCVFSPPPSVCNVH